MKKLSLNNDCPHNYCMLGISSPLSDFKLVLSLNNVLGIALSKIDDFDFSVSNSKKNEPFALFYFQQQLGEIDFFLVSNRSSDSILLPDFKNFDYFFILNCFDIKNRINNIICNINTIDNVQTVINLDLANLKYINHLFSEIELHLLESQNN